MRSNSAGNIAGMAAATSPSVCANANKSGAGKPSARFKTAAKHKDMVPPCTVASLSMSERCIHLAADGISGRLVIDMFGVRDVSGDGRSMDDSVLTATARSRARISGVGFGGSSFKAQRMYVSAALLFAGFFLLSCTSPLWTRRRLALCFTSASLCSACCSLFFSPLSLSLSLHFSALPRCLLHRDVAHGIACLACIVFTRLPLHLS